MSDAPVFVPRWLAKLQRSHLNPVMLRVAPYLPLATIIRHRGRQSGRLYETPVSSYRHGKLLIIALGHGRSQWAQNVLAAGQAEVLRRYRVLHLVRPRLVPVRSAGPELPLLARLLGRRVALLVAELA